MEMDSSTSSDRSQLHQQHPQPLLQTSLLSDYALRTRPSPIRALYPLMKTPGLLQLAGGLPHPQLFPLHQLTMEINGNNNQKYTKKMSESALQRALQYGPTPGDAQLQPLIKEKLIKEHKPPYVRDETDKNEKFEVTITGGSQDGFAKACQMFIDEKSMVLVEEYTYPGALTILRAAGAKLIAIQADKDGIIPNKVEEALKMIEHKVEPAEQHNQQGEHKNIPRRTVCLYVVATGANPSGTSIPNERRVQLYEIACRYNLLILEDDPYAALTYGDAPAPEVDDAFQRPHFRSFLSMDVEQRVIRFDSLSKVFAAGFRLGYVSGPTYLMRHITMLQSNTSLQASGIAQAVAFEVMDTLGDAGWDRHCDQVALFYARRRDHLCRILDKHMSGLVEYTRPVAGMFVWMRFIGITDTNDLLMKKALAAKVLLVPGNAFAADDSLPSAFARASFSLLPEEHFEEAVLRLAKLIREEQQVTASS